MATGEVPVDDQEERAADSVVKSKNFWAAEEPETVIKPDCVVNLEKHLKFYLEGERNAHLQAPIKTCAKN